MGRIPALTNSSLTHRLCQDTWNWAFQTRWSTPSLWNPAQFFSWTLLEKLQIHIFSPEVFLNCSCSQFIVIIPFCLFFCEFVEFGEGGCNYGEVVFMVVSQHSRDGSYVHKISIIITINIKKKSSKSDNNNTAMKSAFLAKHGKLHGQAALPWGRPWT